MEGHDEDVSSVGWSTAETTVASGSHNNTVRIWNAETGECLQTLEGHVKDVWSVA